MNKSRSIKSISTENSSGSEEQNPKVSSSEESK